MDYKLWLPFEIDKNVRSGSNILDWMCWRHQLFRTKYNTYGCVFRFNLKIASKVMSIVLLLIVQGLPFLENSFDAVVSSYFWGAS